MKFKESYLIIKKDVDILYYVWYTDEYFLIKVFIERKLNERRVLQNLWKNSFK